MNGLVVLDFADEMDVGAMDWILGNEVFS